MLIEQVITAGIEWLFGLLTPAGAFIKAIQAVIKIVQFFVDHWDDVVAMVQAFVDTLDAIANGNTAAMATAIEEAMANTVPVIIGFLASLIGVDGFGEKIKTILTNIQTFVDNIQTGIIQKAGDWLGSKGSKERRKKRKEEEEAKKKADEEGDDVEDENGDKTEDNQNQEESDKENDDDELSEDESDGDLTDEEITACSAARKDIRSN